jgi:hypothetical protein
LAHFALLYFAKENHILFDIAAWWRLSDMIIHQNAQFVNRNHKFILYFLWFSPFLCSFCVVLSAKTTFLQKSEQGHDPIDHAVDATRQRAV